MADMVKVIESRFGRSFLVFSALTVWLGSGLLFGLGEPWQRIASYGAGAFAFFLVAMFLPEYRRRRSFSRQGALQFTAFCIWLAASELVRLYPSISRSPLWSMAMLLGSPVLAYYGGLFLIRGSRAAPQYATEAAPEETPLDSPAVLQ